MYFAPLPYHVPPSPPATLVEPCAGSAALTLHLLGAKRAIVPYQGGKWRYRHALAALFASFGREVIREVVLADPGPWGVALPTLLDPDLRGEVIEKLSQKAEQCPRCVFDELQYAPIPSPEEPVRYTVEFLFLQRLSFSGKAVAIDRANCWFSPGFNETSAFGKESTGKFGAIKPMIPSLIRTLKSYDTDLSTPRSLRCVQTHNFFEKGLPGTVCVYIDPPYRNATRYPNGDMTREQVVSLALTWHESGADVVVSEAQPIVELMSRGWVVKELHPGRQDTSPFRGKQTEWVTYLPRKIA